VTESIGKRIPDALRIGQAVRLVWQSAPGWTLANGILLIIQGVLPLVALYLMKLVVDAVSAGITAPDKGAAFGRIMFLIAIAGGVALIDTICRSLTRLVSEAQSAVITDKMHSLLHAKSIEVDLEYYENPKYFDKLHRAQREAPFRPTRILNGLVQLGENSISLIAIAGLLFSFHWGIALVLFITALPGVFVRVRYSNRMFHWQKKHTRDERLSWYFHWMLTGNGHAKEIRLFDLGGLFMDRYRTLREKLRREKLKLSARNSIADLLAQGIATVAVFGSYAFIAFRTISGVITIGDLVMYFQAFVRGQGYLRNVLTSLAGLYEDNLFLSNLFEFLKLKQTVAEPVAPRPIPRPMQKGIMFDQVSFQYPTGNRPVLENVNMAISTGEKIAMVGENGAGKTTLIKLLCRLYDPTSGAVRIDGTDLREYQTTDLRREISVLFQDYIQYDLTARENMWFGNLKLPQEDTRIIAAAQRSGADHVIERFKAGYETVLGKRFDEGEELSIGEWQKVALARAFLRDAQLIILDEPTSAMDAKTESEVLEKFLLTAKDQTVIFISHRFSTVRMADRIYVLEAGRIIGSGTHEELMGGNDTYAQMFEAQARHYR
jgi:ATP-binding cassette subfamily B protein